MGSVVEMGFFKAKLLAIIVAIVLLGGMASIASADTGSHGAAAASFTTSAQCDPSDPGLPPD